MQFPFSLRNKWLTHSENPEVTVDARMRLNIDVGDQTVSWWSERLSDIGVKLQQSLRRSLQNQALLRNDGSDSNVIAKVLIERRAERYPYP